MRVFIAEDDVRSRRMLRHMIEHVPGYEVMGEAKDGEELIAGVLREKPDTVLVDIDMPLLNGMEAVKACKRLQPDLQVIFTTGHKEYAIEAFRVHAIDYIVKPIERDRLYAALEHSAQLLRSRQPIGKSMMIKQHQQMIFVPLEEILFIERAERKAVIHTVQRKYELNEALAKLEDTLDARFVSSHRSYLINLEALERIETAGQHYKAYFKNYTEAAKISKHKLAELQKYKAM